MIEDYITVREGFQRLRGIFSLQDIASCNLLALEEEKFLDHFKREYSKILHFYNQEMLSQRVYLAVIDGNPRFMNNLRGMTSLVLQTRKEKPETHILVHGLGKQLDFGLAYTLDEAVLDPQYWVEKKGVRFSVPTDNLVILLDRKDDWKSINEEV